MARRASALVRIDLQLRTVPRDPASSRRDRRRRYRSGSGREARWPCAASFPRSRGLLPYLATLLSLPVAEDLQHRIAHLDGHAMGLAGFPQHLSVFERLAQPATAGGGVRRSALGGSIVPGPGGTLLPLVSSVPLLLILVGRPERDSRAARLRDRTRERGAGTPRWCSPPSPSVQPALLDGLVPGDQTSARLKQVAIERAEGTRSSSKRLSGPSSPTAGWNGTQRNGTGGSLAR